MPIDNKKFEEFKGAEVKSATTRRNGKHYSEITLIKDGKTFRIMSHEDMVVREK